MLDATFPIANRAGGPGNSPHADSSRIVGSLLVLTGLLLPAGVLAEEPPTAAELEEQGFVSMFNGRDLTGWEGMPDWWEVRDGAIVAESTPDKPSTRTHYLYWTGGRPADFEFRGAYRIHGAGGNSGVQFRSETRPNWDTWGYQADIDTDGEYAGCIYQHGRGLVAERGQRVVIDSQGQKAITPFGDFDDLLEPIHRDDWNHIRLLAQGSRIVYWINGVLMCEVDDHEEQFALREGVLALQMHAGPPMKIEFKDLWIRKLECQLNSSSIPRQRFNSSNCWMYSSFEECTCSASVMNRSPSRGCKSRAPSTLSNSSSESP